MRRFRLLLAIWYALAALDGCYWRRYAELVTTHVELLTAMAGKMEDLFARPRPAQDATMSEFRYPLERARDFARIVRERRGDRESYRRFEAFLRDYQGLVDDADRLRLEPSPGADRIERFHQRVAELRQKATAVREAVKQEG
ncbi:MAG: hypothetical protein QOD06_2691 [Candidatus Binatota bacterium]|nr:hypothetical protein [Candidatus Binatota bacterium]